MSTVLTEPRAEERTPVPQPPQPLEPVAPPSMRAIAVAFLASLAAAWMAARLFRGALPIVAAVLGTVVGTGVVALSTRTRRAALVQYLTLPAAIVVGALLAVPAAGGGGADLPRLIEEAIRTGGLSQPPVAFDPGWRILLVVLVAVIAAASASLAVALGRLKLAVVVPLPLLVGAAALQSEGTALTSSIVAMALMLGALGVAYGEELGGDGGPTGRFEIRRLARAVVILVGLAVALIAISRARFLFPDTTRDQVIPPQRPAAAPPPPDRVLFTVDDNRPGPWRLGALDVYQDNAWMHPPYDRERFEPLPDGGHLATFDEEPLETTTFVIGQIEGHAVPMPARAVQVDGLRGEVTIDPRTGTVRLPERVRPGLRYTVTAAPLPSGRDLARAPAPPDAMAPYLEAPPMPNQVVALLRDAPESLWDRLQFVRARFYENVVAAGAGAPVDVPPRRVVEMLGGQEGSPWEITAAEALLARWAGVPSRIGYGFYRGEERATFTEIRPRHGATWLEVYFEGHGWIPVVGVPPRARSSLNSDPTNSDPNIRPTEELALTVHVPIRLRTVRLLYVAVRYWAGVVLAIGVPLLLLWWAIPGAIKPLRRWRRDRWGRAHGPAGRILVAYAEFRDVAADLGFSEPAMSPVSFSAILEHDDEHDELAWLVTRALWGDLRRDLRDGDADAAEALARSARRRLAAGQQLSARVLAFGSRASLRAPWSTEIPNIYPSWLARRPIRNAARAVGARIRASARRVRARLPVMGAMMAVLALVLSGCSTEAARGQAAEQRPIPPLPATLADFDVRRAPEAEKAYARAGDEALVRPDGLVYTIHDGPSIEAYIQVATFKDEYDALEREVREGVLRSIGGGRFRSTRIGAERAYVQQLPEQRMLLSFTPDGRAMLLLVARRSFEAADDVFVAMLQHVRGERPGTTSGVVRYDPRRGGEP